MDVYMGYSEADITPDYSAELIGFLRPDNTSKGILHRLKAQVLILKSPGEVCCLITIDSLGFTTQLSNQLRKQAAERLQVTQEKVMLCFSHTHSAPNAGTEDKIYYKFVCEHIMSAVSAAALNLCLIKAAWEVNDCEIGINRRSKEEIVDNRIGILKIVDALSDKIKILILRVTAHANVLSSDNYLISSDYFGLTRELLKEKYDCEIMLIQGAAGDIRPKYQQENAQYLETHSYEESLKKFADENKEKFFGQSMQALEEMANQIYKSVDTVIDKLAAESVDKLFMFSKRSRFAADVPTVEYAYKIAEEARDIAGIDGTAWLNEVKRLNAENIKQQFGDIEIQYFGINNGCICGIANEAMCEIAINIMRKAKNRLLLFGGYTNGCNSYLPTAEEYDKGGYEVLWSNLIYYCYHGRVMPFNRETADKLEDDVALYWKQCLMKKNNKINEQEEGIYE